jgi:hypothetical protein
MCGSRRQSGPLREYETYAVVEKTGDAGDVALERILVDRRLPVAAVRYAA